MKHLIWLVLTAALVAPAAAQQREVTTDFYIVRDQGTKRCEIVDKKPTTTTTTTIVDNGRSYKTRTEAETSMKTTKVCTE